MIPVIICGWFLRRLVRLFGMETFSMAAAYSLPEPVLFILDEYIREVPA